MMHHSMLSVVAVAALLSLMHVQSSLFHGVLERCSLQQNKVGTTESSLWSMEKGFSLISDHGLATRDDDDLVFQQKDQDVSSSSNNGIIADAEPSTMCTLLFTTTAPSSHNSNVVPSPPTSITQLRWAVSGFFIANGLLQGRWLPLVLWCCAAHLIVFTSQVCAKLLVLAIITQSLLTILGRRSNKMPRRRTGDDGEDDDTASFTRIRFGLLVCACAVWTAAVIFDDGATASGESSQPPLFPNYVPWLSISVGILLQLPSRLQTRRMCALVVSCMGGTVALLCLLVRFFGWSNRNSDGTTAVSHPMLSSSWVQHRLVHPAREYANSIDVTRREAPWSPGSMFLELLVYGFRSQAAACIIYAAAFPFVLVVISTTRLKLKFESMFLLCVLCDHTTTLSHFAIAVLLYSRRASSSAPASAAVVGDAHQQQQEQQKQILKRFALSAGTSTMVVSLSYFAAWGSYRSAQQNMSLYALFGTHLFAAIWILLDLEVEETVV